MSTNHCFSGWVQRKLSSIRDRSVIKSLPEFAYFGTGAICSLMPGLSHSAAVIGGAVVTCSPSVRERHDCPRSSFLAGSSTDVTLVPAANESEVTAVYTRPGRELRVKQFNN